jgi:hypothetical protein
VRDAAVERSILCILAAWQVTSLLQNPSTRAANRAPAFPEWMFNEVEFDGFNSGECLLKEAKTNYDQFLKNSFEPYFWWEKNAEKMVDQAYRQGISAQPSPPTRLRWHFMTPIAFRYFSRLIISASLVSSYSTYKRAGRASFKLSVRPEVNDWKIPLGRIKKNLQFRFGNQYTRHLVHSGTPKRAFSKTALASAG